MLTPDQLEIRDLARDFAQGEIAPHVERWDAEAALPDALYRSLAEVGFFGMLVGEAHGGLALDLASYLIVVEELARVDPATALVVSVQNGPVTRALEAAGTAAQKDRWLPALAAGEALAAAALGDDDEADGEVDGEGGGDGAGAALGTEAREEGGGWVLDGTRAWVAQGGRADLALVFAHTPGAAAPTAFLVPTATPGYRVVGRTTTMGFRAAEMVAVAFDGVALPADALLGEVGGGLPILDEARTAGRLGMAAIGVGIGAAALDHAVGYARVREQFGRPLADFGAIRAKVAEMALRVAAARAAVREVGARVQRVRAGHPDDGSGAEVLVARVAGAKLLAAETAMYASDEAVQIFGGYGYMRDYPVEKLMRDAKGTEVLEGTSEFLRMAIAREVLGRWRTS